MSSIDLALPNRSVQVAAKPFSPPAGFLFTVIVMAVLLGFFGWWQGPGLWRDVQIAQNPQVLPNGQVLDGECSTRRGLTDCDARLVYDYNGESHESYVSLAFLDFSSGDYEVEVVISRDKPELATISLGLDMLWNRLIVFGVFMLLFAGGLIAILAQALHAWSANRALAVPSRLTVVPVELIEVHKAVGARHATYVDHPKGPKSRRSLRTRLARGEEPLLAVDEDGKWVALAVRTEHVDMPVLLDRNLERLDLMPAEREQALAALDAQRAGRVAVAETVAAKPKAGFSVWRRLAVFLVVLLLLVAGVLAYWLYYVTAGPDAFDSVGMEINNMMPEPINLWACGQLEARFGDSNAPYGCTAADYVSWKTAASGKIKG